MNNLLIEIQKRNYGIVLINHSANIDKSNSNSQQNIDGDSLKKETSNHPVIVQYNNIKVAKQDAITRFRVKKFMNEDANEEINVNRTLIHKELSESATKKSP